MSLDGFQNWVIERQDIVRYLRRLTQLRPYLGLEELAQRIEDGDHYRLRPDLEQPETPMKIPSIPLYDQGYAAGYAACIRDTEYMLHSIRATPKMFISSSVEHDVETAMDTLVHVLKILRATLQGFKESVKFPVK